MQISFWKWPWNSSSKMLKISLFNSCFEFPSKFITGISQGTLKREYSAQSKQCARDTNAFQRKIVNNRLIFFCHSIKWNNWAFLQLHGQKDFKVTAYDVNILLDWLANQAPAVNCLIFLVFNEHAKFFVSFQNTVTRILSDLLNHLTDCFKLPDGLVLLLDNPVFT